MYGAFSVIPEPGLEVRVQECIDSTTGMDFASEYIVDWHY